MAAGTELQKNRAPYSRSSELVLPGNKAKYRTPDRQPVFVITSEPNEMPLVRLEPGKDDRNLKIGSGSRVPYGGGSSRRGIRGEDMVDVDAERDSRGFYRIRPRAPLEPGEYGFVSSRGGGATYGRLEARPPSRRSVSLSRPATKRQGCRFIPLPVSRPASTIRRTTSSGIGLF